MVAFMEQCQLSRAETCRRVSKTLYYAQVAEHYPKYYWASLYKDTQYEYDNVLILV